MKNVLTSIRLVLVTLIVCSVVYTGLIWAIAAVLVPAKAEGSLIRDAGGRVVGSRQIAQKFTQPKYFWPRPSAVDYNGAGAGGSNLSPANPAVAERATGIIAALAPAPGERVPADLLAASGSGLDPHITEAAARFQARRVAAARGLRVERVEQVVDQLAASPEGFGLGERIVNVLELNLALDSRFATPEPPTPAASAQERGR
jgi:K+-transporting ATPase ATPase C chain